MSANGDQIADVSTIEVNTTWLFERLGRKDAEVGILTEEKMHLQAEVGRLRGMLVAFGVNPITAELFEPIDGEGRVTGDERPGD